MPSLLTRAQYGEALGTAGTVVRAQAGTTSLSTPVPTCPGWTMRDLVVHLGVVYRWASAIVEGQSLEAAAAVRDAAEQEGRSAPDLIDWLDDALVIVLNTLATAPEDLDVFFFLKNTPDKRLGWTRRQAHEAAIHAVDAMAAKLGTVPTRAQLWLKPDFAADGIDELIMGFAPRSKQALRAETPFTLEVRCTDHPSAWSIDIGPGPAVSSMIAGSPDRSASAMSAGDPANPAKPAPDAVISGRAVDLYLALWNRGSAGVTCEGSIDALGLWNRSMIITF